MTSKEVEGPRRRRLKAHLKEVTAQLKPINEF
jgi:hypothetical protein